MRKDHRAIALAALAAGLFAALPARAGYVDGIRAYEEERYADAAEQWQPLAEQGDPKAEFSLGLLYYKGQGVTKDPVKAYVLFAKAAAEGEALASKMVGQLATELTPEQRRQAQSMLERSK